MIPDGVDIGPERARPGDVVIVTGPVGSHGVLAHGARALLDLGRCDLDSRTDAG